jgi:hypothetical protein
LLLIFFGLSLAWCAQGQRLLLSPHSQVNVITCGPSQDQLYAAFGHSAFRVTDPAQGIDWVYNYGVFDFDKPNFYLNFARGYLNYRLAVGPYDRFVYTYQYYNRFVHEQVLSLDSAQRQRLFDFLQWNALPENQYYRYDYFYDNCATRIRDALVKVFGDTVRFDGSYIPEPRSFRDLTDLYLKNQPWGDLGIDICLGLPMDKQATANEHMFLPDYISEAFSHARIAKDGALRPLVSHELITFAAVPEPVPFSPFHPGILFSAVLIVALILTYRDLKHRSRTRSLDGILFLAAGMTGWLLVFLWTATDHTAARPNFNILWALPTHVLVLLTLNRRPAKWVRDYFMRCALLTALLVIAWPWLPQQLNINLLPLVIALGVRCYVIGSLPSEEGAR